MSTTDKPKLTDADRARVLQMIQKLEEVRKEAAQPGKTALDQLAGIAKTLKLAPSEVVAPEVVQQMEQNWSDPPTALQVLTTIDMAEYGKYRATDVFKFATVILLAGLMEQSGEKLEDLLPQARMWRSALAA